MIYDFFVRGSAKAPYKVSFIFDMDSGVKVKCECPAGKKKTLCKHILNLTDGDITNLENECITNLKEMLAIIKNTDFHTNLLKYKNSLSAANEINQLYRLSPKPRRKSIELDQGTECLYNHGFAKGNGGANYIDFYNSDKNYVGSIKTPKSVFNTNLKELLNIDLEIITRKDKQLHNTSLGIYLFLNESQIDELFKKEQNSHIYKEKLKGNLI